MVKLLPSKQALRVRFSSLAQKERNGKERNGQERVGWERIGFNIEE